MTQVVIDFIVPNRREIQRSVMKRLLKRFLLGSSMAYCNDRYGQILEPDTEDELEDGVADPSLNYLNPLWKLRLVRTYGEIEFRFGFWNRWCCELPVPVVFYVFDGACLLLFYKSEFVCWLVWLVGGGWSVASLFDSLVIGFVCVCMG